MLMMQEVLEMLSKQEMLSSRSAKSCDDDADDAGGAGHAEQ